MRALACVPEARGASGRAAPCPSGAAWTGPRTRSTAPACGTRTYRREHVCGGPITVRGRVSVRACFRFECHEIRTRRTHRATPTRWHAMPVPRQTQSPTAREKHVRRRGRRKERRAIGFSPLLVAALEEELDLLARLARLGVRLVVLLHDLHVGEADVGVLRTGIRGERKGRVILA